MSSKSISQVEKGKCNYFSRIMVQWSTKIKPMKWYFLIVFCFALCVEIISEKSLPSTTLPWNSLSCHYYDNVDAFLSSHQALDIL